MDDVQELQGRIVVNPRVLLGEPVVRGMGVAVEFITDLLARGWTVQQVRQKCDHLTEADIRACLAHAGQMLKSDKVHVTPD